MPAEAAMADQGPETHWVVILATRIAFSAKSALCRGPAAQTQKRAANKSRRAKEIGNLALRRGPGNARVCGLLCREAVEQAVAAGGDEVGLAAAARLVRGIPGALEFVVGAAAAVDVANLGLAEFAAHPVVA